MAGGPTTSYANKILDHILKGTALPQPTNIFVGLATADPGDDPSLGGIAEPVGNAYARVNVNTLFGAASSAQKKNNADITFPVPTGSWGNISWWFLTDGTNVMWTGSVTNTKPVGVGDTVKFLNTILTLALNRVSSGGMTTNEANRILNHITKGTAYAQPTNILCGLATADPGANPTLGGITEVSGGSYARVNVNAVFGAASGAVKANSVQVAFATASAGWGTVTHAFLTDGTNVLWSGPLTSSKTVASGDDFKIPIGDLALSLLQT